MLLSDKKTPLKQTSACSTTWDYSVPGVQGLCFSVITRATTAGATNIDCCSLSAC